MKLFSLGEIILGVEHRGGEDGGPSLHLLVRTLKNPPQQETRRFQQVWRADCFRLKPHEHLFGPTGEVIRDLPTKDVARSIDWAIDHLLTDGIKKVVREAGYPETAHSLLEVYFTDEFLWEVRTAMFKPAACNA